MGSLHHWIDFYKSSMSDVFHDKEWAREGEEGEIEKGREGEEEREGGREREAGQALES